MALPSLPQMEEAKTLAESRLNLGMISAVEVADTYKEAGANSPKVKFITGFFNRIVGAYRVEGTEPNGPVSVVWCADADTTKWPNDAPPDISTGQTPLVDSPSDLADFITGIF